jgi:hypothetical protein
MLQWLDLRFVGGTWEPGAYEVVANEASCDLALPATDAAVCTPWYLELRTTEDGAALTDAWMWVTPDTVDLMVLYEGEPLLMETVEPRYRTNDAEFCPMAESTTEISMDGERRSASVL